MFIICRGLIEGKYKGALTKWGDKWYHATSLAKPTIFENKEMAEIVASTEVQSQFPEDKITVQSIDIFQNKFPY